MPGADTQYNEVVLAEKLIQFKDLLSKYKYDGIEFWEDGLLTLKKRFEEIIPYRLEYFECEREILENFNKVWEILNSKK